MKKKDLPYLSTDINKSICQPKKMNNTFIKSFTVAKQKDDSYEIHNESDTIRRRKTFNTERVTNFPPGNQMKLVLRKREQINALPRPSQRYSTLNTNYNENKICLTDKSSEVSIVRNKAVSSKNLPRFVMSYKTSTKAVSSKNLVRLNNNKTIRVIDFSQISIGEQMIKPKLIWLI